MERFSLTKILALLISLVVMSGGCKDKTPKYSSGYMRGPCYLDIDAGGEDSSLVIYTLHFNDVDLVCGKMPDYNVETDIIFCCEAAFTGELLEEFSHGNIAGNHISGGVLYKGYDCPDNTGEFIAAKGTVWGFVLTKSKPGSECDIERSFMLDENDLPSVNGFPVTMGFGQNMIIYDFKTQPRFRDRLPDGKYYFRSLCCLNGELCIVDSKEEIRYAEYVELLEQLGVQYALYLDMGSGWNHSWFREKPGAEVTIIHPWIEKCKYTTNWIVFR